jgi:hypothetical protein
LYEAREFGMDEDELLGGGVYENENDLQQYRQTGPIHTLPIKSVTSGTR